MVGEALCAPNLAGLFDGVRGTLTRLERMTDDEAVDLIRSARQRVSREVRELTERKEERDREAEEDDTDWGELLKQVSRNADPAPTREFDRKNGTKVSNYLDEALAKGKPPASSPSR